MTERSQTGEQNLTGVWHGLYSYPDGVSVSFVATLIEVACERPPERGSTHEPSVLGDGQTVNADRCRASRQQSLTSHVRHARPTARRQPNSSLPRNSIDYDAER